MINTSIVKDNTTSEGDRTLSASVKSAIDTAVLLNMTMHRKLLNSQVEDYKLFVQSLKVAGVQLPLSFKAAGAHLLLSLKVAGKNDSCHLRWLKCYVSSGPR